MTAVTEAKRLASVWGRLVASRKLLILRMSLWVLAAPAALFATLGYDLVGVVFCLGAALGIMLAYARVKCQHCGARVTGGRWNMYPSRCPECHRDLSKPADGGEAEVPYATRAAEFRLIPRLGRRGWLLIVYGMVLSNLVFLATVFARGDEGLVRLGLAATAVNTTILLAVALRRRE